jgi:hypothetical protein
MRDTLPFRVRIRQIPGADAGSTCVPVFGGPLRRAEVLASGEGARFGAGYLARRGCRPREAFHHPAVAQRGPGPVDHALAQLRQRLVGLPQRAPAPVQRDVRVLHHVLGRPGLAQQQRGQVFDGRRTGDR